MKMDNLMKKKEWLNALRNNFYISTKDKELRPIGAKLYHYTSLPVLFNILENDSVWVSGTRFSNDSSEELLLRNENFRGFDYRGDNFIMCFSDKSDCLSQWRGYCPNGGAAIEFDIRQPRNYSILHADHETSKKYELECNAPFPVLYVGQELISPSSDDLPKQLIEDSTRYSPLNPKDIIPFFKDRAFEEESEWRLMFANHEGELSKCVRFRTIKDGVKVPYMIVKSGDMGKNYSKCLFNSAEYTSEKMDDMSKKGIPIRIPEGNDQESVYYKMEAIAATYNKSKSGGMPIKVFCEGHLPIRRIIVAPTYDRERVAEKIKRYCWSIYWLRNIDVEYSHIPYIPPSE